MDKLFYLSGIAVEYLDYAGEHRVIPHRDRLEALELSGYRVDSDAAIEAELFQLDAVQWLQWLLPQYITLQSEPTLALHCHPDQLDITLQWQLQTEQGDIFMGSVVPGELPESGEYYLHGIRYSARSLFPDHAPENLPLGYHQLTVSSADRTQSSQLIVAPQRCFELPNQSQLDTDTSAAKTRLWGINCQLYSLRSANNWGIGDFGDLALLVERSADLGAAMICLNPLHLLLDDQVVSPYSPSDRRFINPLYIDLTQVPEMQSADLQQQFNTDEVVAELQRLREMEWVDYAAVGDIKYRFFDLCYQQFNRAEVPGSSRRAAFEKFVSDAGEPLQQLALYEANENSRAVRYRDQPEFFNYLQWLAAGQLEACQALATDSGMAVGLMGDLAVGSVAQGCEVGQNRDLYLPQVAIGAPPDPFSSSGQNWGLPVLNPSALRRDNFRSYIELLRANMRAVGGLRIDHVMSLMRLWWCLPVACSEGEKVNQPARGLYVYYPMREMLMLLCLESHRNHCLVVGEDMGVVPETFRREMKEANIYGNDLLYFTQRWDGTFWAPNELRSETLLLVTNHDTPTLNDWWSGDDIERRLELGVINDQCEAEQVREQRRKDKLALLRWLQQADHLPNQWRAGLELHNVEQSMDWELLSAIHRVCACSCAGMMVLQLDDLQLMKLPQNIPSTNQEYPNWRRKQRVELEELFASTAVLELLKTIDQERCL